MHVHVNERTEQKASSAESSQSSSKSRGSKKSAVPNGDAVQKPSASRRKLRSADAEQPASSQHVEERQHVSESTAELDAKGEADMQQSGSPVEKPAKKPLKTSNAAGKGKIQDRREAKMQIKEAREEKEVEEEDKQSVCHPSILICVLELSSSTHEIIIPSG